MSKPIKQKRGIKRAYQKKLDERLVRRKNFLIERFAREWEKMERAAKKEKQVREAKRFVLGIGKTILKLLAVSGIVSVAIAAPNILVAYDALGRRKKYISKKSFQRSLYYLKRQEYLTVLRKDELYRIRITKKGLAHICRSGFARIRIEKPRAWDGVWRVVMFDIPDRHKVERDDFRGKLTQLGFFRLQHSVFVYPYPCKEEVSFIASVFSITPYIRYLETNRVSYDRDLKDFFNLA